MKYCTNCGNKLGDNASVCLKCGKAINNSANNKNKNKKGLPAWAIVLIVLGAILLIPIIFLVLCYLLFVKIDKKYDYDYDYDYEEESVLDYGTIGDTLDTGNLSFTLNNYELTLDTDESYGQEYLILYFDVKNIGDKPAKISSYDFTGYSDYEYASVKKLHNNDLKFLEGTIRPGETINGYVAFLVNSDWDEFEISYNNYKDNEITFWIENKYYIN